MAIFRDGDKKFIEYLRKNERVFENIRQLRFIFYHSQRPIRSKIHQLIFYSDILT